MRCARFVRRETPLADLSEQSALRPVRTLGSDQPEVRRELWRSEVPRGSSAADLDAASPDGGSHGTPHHRPNGGGTRRALPA